MSKFRTYDDVVSDIRLGYSASSPSPFWIGIDGPGASGKSVLSGRLASEFSTAKVIHMDDFYAVDEQDRSVLPGVGPIPFDVSRLNREVIRPLNAGEPCTFRTFDWKSGNLGEERTIVGASLIMLEGVFSLSGLIETTFDVSVWAHASRQRRVERAFERDGQEGLEKWTKEWMPLEDAYMCLTPVLESVDNWYIGDDIGHTDAAKRELMELAVRDDCVGES